MNHKGDNLSQNFHAAKQTLAAMSLGYVLLAFCVLVTVSTAMNLVHGRVERARTEEVERAAKARQVVVDEVESRRTQIVVWIASGKISPLTGSVDPEVIRIEQRQLLEIPELGRESMDVLVLRYKELKANVEAAAAAH